MIDTSNVKGHKYQGSSIADGTLYHSLPQMGMPTHRKDTNSRYAMIRKALPFNIFSKVALDLGCNTGAFVLRLSQDVKVAMGVDYDKESIDVAWELGRYFNRTNVEFKCADIDHSYIKGLGSFNIVLWLSQWMWARKQYGDDVAKSMLWDMSKKTLDFMFFECAGNDGSAPTGMTQDEIGKMFEDNTCFFNHENIGPTEWGNRRIYRGSMSFIVTQGSVLQRICPGVVRKIFKPENMWMKERAVKALQRLGKYENFPKLVNVGGNHIDLSYCGKPTDTYDMGQCDAILRALSECRIKHRDIRKDNILKHNGKLYLIDFGWCLFDDEVGIPGHETHPLLGCGNYQNGVWDDVRAMKLTRELYG